MNKSKPVMKLLALCLLLSAPVMAKDRFVGLHISTPTPDYFIMPSTADAKSGDQLEWACQHDWEPSYYSLFDTSTKTIHRQVGIDYGVYRETETIPGYIGNVQICKKCGLIRINPKELRK